jgi:hypothetical protein
MRALSIRGEIPFWNSSLLPSGCTVTEIVSQVERIMWGCKSCKVERRTDLLLWNNDQRRGHCKPLPFGIRDKILFRFLRKELGIPANAFQKQQNISFPIPGC